MSLNTSMPYYRNTSREVKTVREIIQNEVIKSARLTSRDKIKIKQNTSIGDLNRSKRKVNHSFYDNRSNSQIENQNNILSSYLANAFHEKKETIVQQGPTAMFRQQLAEISNKPKQDEAKQKEIKYLMRIAALEKEAQKLNEAVERLKKENQQLKQSANLEMTVIQLQESLVAQKQENAALKRYVSQLQNTAKKTDRLNTSNTMNTTNSNSTIKQREFVPSYMLALSLVN